MAVWKYRYFSIEIESLNYFKFGCMCVSVCVFIYIGVIWRKNGFKKAKVSIDCDLALLYLDGATHKE